MDYAEFLAKRLFENVLPGAKMVYRAVQSNGEHDFDLLHPDGRQAIVEVTTAIDKDLQETWRQILHKGKGGGIIRPRLCKRTWSIRVRSGTRIDPIRKRVDSYLAAIERAGISCFRASTDLSPEVRAIYQDLSVVDGSALPHIGPPLIILGLPGPPGKLTDSVAIEAAGWEAIKPDNRRKLGACMSGDRHLAVYAPPHALASFGLWMRQPPRYPVNLPSEISHLWIFGDDFATPDDVVVWWGESRSQWHKVRINLQQFGNHDILLPGN